jgi:hypothetical protein
VYLHDLLQPILNQVSLFPEQELTGRRAKVRGVADLVIRGAKHAVFDYKTGAGIDRATGYLRDRYRRQLLLYSAMEAEQFGTWPESASMISLTGTHVDIGIDPPDASSEMDRALEALDAYNRLVPGTQPANPAPEVCGYCPFAARCPAYWDAADRLEGLDSVEGELVQVNIATMGSILVTISPSGGTVRDDPTIVRGLEASDITPEELVPGTAIRIVGLWYDAGRSVYRVRESASVLTGLPVHSGRLV